MATDGTSGFSTESIHAGTTARHKHARDVVSSIHLSSTFQLDAVPTDTALTDLDPANGEYLYTRLGNPTRQSLEETLATITGGEHAFGFASGTSAVVSTVLSTVTAGEDIVAFDDLYGGSLKLLSTLIDERLGIPVQFVDARDPANVEAAVTDDTALVLMETPTNPMLHLCDIEAIADIATGYEVPLAVDNTFASPYFQRPLDLGADIEIHSTTKFLNGHSDGLGGAVITNDDDVAADLAFAQQIGLGNPIAPFDAYLVDRGIKTLKQRMAAHADNAMAIARFLEDHPHVERVRYPGLPSHPQHELAREQMTGFGGVVSFELDGTGEQAVRFLEALETFSLAVSLGGVESLIELPAEMTHGSLDPAVREARGISDTLIRASIGIEDLADLERDLERGFAAAFGDNA